MIQRPIPITYQHRVAFTHGAFEPKNHTLCDLIAESSELGTSSKVLVLLDSGVAEENPQLATQISSYSAAHSNLINLVSPPMEIIGGEGCKNDWSLVEKIWQAVEYHTKSVATATSSRSEAGPLLISPDLPLRRLTGESDSSVCRRRHSARETAVSE